VVSSSLRPGAFDRELIVQDPTYGALAEAQPRTEASRAGIMRSTVQSPVIDLADPVGMSTPVHTGYVITVSARQTQYYLASRAFIVQQVK
jgi:hypothetical protein